MAAEKRERESCRATMEKKEEVESKEWAAERERDRLGVSLYPWQQASLRIATAMGGHGTTAVSRRGLAEQQRDKRIGARWNESDWRW